MKAKPEILPDKGELITAANNRLYLFRGSMDIVEAIEGQTPRNPSVDLPTTPLPESDPTPESNPTTPISDLEQARRAVNDIHSYNEAA